MGHIVNANSHRLGFSKCWNSIWSNDLSFSNDYSSLVKYDWNFFFFFKRFFDFKILMQGGYIFSHVKVIRNRQKIFCVVYFYDGSSLERSDNLKYILFSKTYQIFNLYSLFFVSLYSFLKIYQWNVFNIKFFRNFRFDLIFNYFKRRKKFLLRKKYIRLKSMATLYKLKKIFFDYSMVLSLSFFSSLNVFQFCFLIFLEHYKNIFSLSFVKQNLNFNLLKNFLLNSFFIIKNDLYFKNNNSTIFFKNIIVFFLFSKWLLFKRITNMSRFIRLGIQNFFFNRFILYFFGDFFSLYYRVRSRMYNSVKMNLSKMPFDRNLNKISIELKKLDVSDLNASVLAKYLTIRLKQRFQLKEALMPMLRHLAYNQYVKGFRIVCAGRFTRKEIALYDLRTYSSVPFSGVTSRLDFALSEVVLKYSICGIKVWLHRRVLPEREFAIDAIGLQFIPMPAISEDFFENLKDEELDSSIMYNPNIMDNDIFNVFLQYENNLKSRNKLALFLSRLTPSFDFFFFDMKHKFYFRKKSVSKSKFYELKKKFMFIF